MNSPILALGSPIVNFYSAHNREGPAEQNNNKLGGRFRCEICPHSIEGEEN